MVITGQAKIASATQVAIDKVGQEIERHAHAARQ
jgi:hypothetical protein